MIFLEAGKEAVIVGLRGTAYQRAESDKKSLVILALNSTIILSSPHYFARSHNPPLLDLPYDDPKHAPPLILYYHGRGPIYTSWCGPAKTTPRFGGKPQKGGASVSRLPPACDLIPGLLVSRLPNICSFD